MAEDMGNQWLTDVPTDMSNETPEASLSHHCKSMLQSSGSSQLFSHPYPKQSLSFPSLPPASLYNSSRIRALDPYQVRLYSQ